MAAACPSCGAATEAGERFYGRGDLILPAPPGRQTPTPSPSPTPSPTPTPTPTPTPSPTPTPTPTPSPTPTPLDSDGDGVPDTLDNCPSVSNPGQENTDAALAAAGAGLGSGNPPVPLAADGLGDACDLDDDNDGFADAVETAIGTNPPDKCPVVSGPGTGGDSWPLDNVVNGLTNVVDLLSNKDKVPSAVDSTHPKRLDINNDNFLNVIDLLEYKGKVPSACN